MQREEDRIQREVVRHLTTRGTDGIWFHCPNGAFKGRGKAGAIRGRQQKSLGVRAGVSDIIAYRNREAFALELKAPKGKPTIEQLEFQSEWRANGGHAVVAEGLDEALAILESWGLLRRAA